MPSTISVLVNCHSFYVFSQDCHINDIQPQAYMYGVRIGPFAKA